MRATPGTPPTARSRRSRRSRPRTRARSRPRWSATIACGARCPRGCPAADGAGAWILDASRAQISRPRRHLSLHAALAARLSGRARRDRDRARRAAPRDMPLLTWSDLSRWSAKQLAIVDVAAPMKPLATCPGYRVLGSDEAIAIAEDAATRSSWISVGTSASRRGGGVCRWRGLARARSADALDPSRHRRVRRARRCQSRRAGRQSPRAADPPRVWPPCATPAPFRITRRAPAPGPTTADAWSSRPAWPGARDRVAGRGRRPGAR